MKCGVALPHIDSDLLENGFASSLVLGILQSHVTLIQRGTQQQLPLVDVVSLGSRSKETTKKYIP